MVNVYLLWIVRCSLQPTCFDRNVTRAGNQTYNCDSGLLNEANLVLGPPSDALCCLVRTVHCVNDQMSFAWCVCNNTRVSSGRGRV
jgi:hypothetical protein